MCEVTQVKATVTENTPSWCGAFLEFHYICSQDVDWWFNHAVSTEYTM
jgi:hypothetical protein